MLNISLEAGVGKGERIVLVHGFTQTGRVWRELSDNLACTYEVVAVDLPGHGRADPTQDAFDIAATARELGEAGGNATYIGYSLGARILMRLAVDNPEVVGRMIVVGTHTQIEDAALARERHDADSALADEIDQLGAAGRLRVFIDDWLSRPFNARLPEKARHRDMRLRNRWQGLSASLRHRGTADPQNASLQELSQLEMPVLIVYGEHDIESVAADCEAMAGAIGANASIERFEGVGHSVPFEAPDLFAAMVERFVTNAER